MCGENDVYIDYFTFGFCLVSGLIPTPIQLLSLYGYGMNVDSPTQTKLEQKEKTTEQHLEEVDEMLTEIDQRVSKPEGTTFRQNVEKAEHYSNDEEYWQEQTAMTRGMTSIKNDEKLSDPEQHAKGATKLKQKHDIDATTIAKIQINGLGKTQPYKQNTKSILILMNE